MRLTSLMICLFLPFSAMADGAPRQIKVTGTGVAVAVPDMAEISVGFTAYDRIPSEAMNQASTVIAAILDQLSQEGIAPRDVQTTRLSLSPIYDRRPNSGTQTPEITGYEASNILTIRVRDLDRLGEILGAVLSDKANRLNNLSFTVQDPAPLLTQARQAAVADARMRAETFASAAGVELGDVLSISESGGGMRPPMAEMRMASDAVPIAAGEESFSASVTIVYTLK